MASLVLAFPFDSGAFLFQQLEKAQKLDTNRKSPVSHQEMAVCLLQACDSTWYKPITGHFSETTGHDAFLAYLLALLEYELRDGVLFTELGQTQDPVAERHVGAESMVNGGLESGGPCPVVVGRAMASGNVVVAVKLYESASRCVEYHVDWKFGLVYRPKVMNRFVYSIFNSVSEERDPLTETERGRRYDTLE